MATGLRLRQGILLTAVMGLCSPALADEVPPLSSYQVVTPGGKYVFVMLSPMTVEQDAGRFSTARGDEIRDIRRRYKKSGLYRNDGSADPLWTVDWFAMYVHVASDGVHLVRVGPYSKSPKQEAFSFFASGELVRTYGVDELVSSPGRLPRTAASLIWRTKAAFDDESRTYSVRTADDNQYVFDITTGEIVTSVQPARKLLWGIVGFIGVLVAVLLTCFWWMWRSGQGSARSDEQLQGPLRTHE